MIISFVGDVMLHDSQMKNLKDPFDNVKSIFKESDIVIGNLETTLCGNPNNIKGKSNTPKFCAPDDFIYHLKNAGFTHLGCYNNHVLDFGKEAHKRTKEIISSYGISVLSQNTSINEDINISCATTHINNAPDDIFTYSEKAIKKPINIMYIHWGGQYNLLKNYDQIYHTDKLINLGYNIIIGSGPHVVQEVSEKNNIICANSLGDFFSSHQNKIAKNEGMILQLNTNEFKFKTYYTKTINNKVEIKKEL